MGDLVTVILTCFNGQRWIAGAIQSVLAQTYPHWELIVVNDGSTDGSQQVIEKFMDPRIQRIEQANRGIPGARNRGLQEAKGDFIAILDQDDLWHPEKLARQVAYLMTRPEVGVVYTNADHIDAEGRVIRRRYGTPPGEGWLLEAFLRAGVAAPIVTTLIRRECLDAVGPLNERLYGWDDYELLVRLASQFRFGYLDEPLVQLRYHPTSAWSSERMLLDRFIVADELAASFPQHAGLIRRFRAAAHYSYGQHLRVRGDQRRARGEFLKAIQTHPGLWRASLAWLSTFVRGWKGCAGSSGN